MRIDRIDPVHTDERIHRNKVVKNNNKLASRDILAWRGEWDTNIPYEIGDVVSDGGSLWIALTKNISTQPVEGADWTTMFSGSGSSRAFAMFIS